MSHVPAALLEQYTGALSRRALEFSYLEQELVKQAVQPGSPQAKWSDLAEMVATGSFERIGNYREKVNWQQYCDLLKALGAQVVWNFTVCRVAEADRFCMIERADALTMTGSQSTEKCGTVSIFEFDDAGKIVRLTVYAQFEQRHTEQFTSAWTMDAVKANYV